ncbi:UNVERIFIED_CONTAM: putative mitochondrial protein [Sesamum angustifolium]|uniref:Mitochondrial protein n=1 Tax=Sesamum angustifolium TaxID=2727405 RepID=A0AAW2IXU4_9LAMI
MSQERGEVWNRRDASRAGLLEMRPFGKAKSISGHQTLQLMKRPYGVKGSVYVVTLPAFQRCLEDGPDAAERRPGSGFPTGRGAGRPSQGASRPTGNTGETWEGNPIGSQRIHSTRSLPDFIFIIFESGGKGSLFCNGKKTEQI